MSEVCQKVSLGQSPRIREVKVIWTNDGPFGLPSPTLKCRDGWYEAYAEFCGPNDILDRFWSVIQDCAKNSALAAIGVSVILENPGAALPAFQASFTACLKDKIPNEFQNIIERIGIALSVAHESSDWGSC